MGDTRHAAAGPIRSPAPPADPLSAVSYLIHTADDDAITAADRVSLYNNIAPQITVPAGQAVLPSPTGRSM